MPVTRTKTITHAGFDAEISITKTDAGFYTATATICYQGDCYDNIDFCDGESIPGRRNGQTFDENPYQFIAGYVEGVIDVLAENKIIADAKGSDVNLMIIKYGKERVMAAIRSMKTIDKNRKKPVFKATPQQAKQCKERITELIDMFGSLALSEMMKDSKGNENYSRVNFNMWKMRGRISTVGAHEVSQHPKIAGAGFTREYLRPDIEDWSEIEK